MRNFKSLFTILVLVGSTYLGSDAFAIEKLERGKTSVNVVKKKKRQAAKIGARATISKADIYGA